MRFFTFFLSLLLLTGIAHAQTYYLNNGFSSGQTVSTCSGTFYDSNPTGNYNSNENYTVTFCPGVVGSKTRISFSSINLSSGDSLEVFDGVTASNKIGVFYQGTATDVFIATNVSGCITFKFTSTNTIPSAGWEATISCGPPCQAIVGSITSNPAANANGDIYVCLGQSLQLNANIGYPQNNTGYNQSNATSFFKWKLGFATDTLGLNITTINKAITQAAGYRVNLVVTDSNGCKNAQALNVKIKTSIPPKFNIQAPTICLKDTALLIAKPVSSKGYFITPPFSGDSIAIPDHPSGSSGVCIISYYDTIKINSFANGQTLTNVNDFLGVFMNMEHSFIGDLLIHLIAPNGTVIRLKPYINGFGGNTGADLGEPVYGDDVLGSKLFPGKGYDYGFTNTPTYNTMINELPGVPSHTYIMTNGLPVPNAPQKYLPAGTYTPGDPFTNLMGTPLNGNWIIRICDHVNIDNGVLFNWSLKFNPNIYPNNEEYSIGFKNRSWLPSPSLVWSNIDTAKISPTFAGTFPYTFRIVDSANCTYDTTINVIVNLLPNKPNLGIDTAVCDGQPFTLAVKNIQAGITYTWSTGATGTSITTSQAGTYWVVATNASGCLQKDTINVTTGSVDFGVSLGADKFYCNRIPITLSPTLSGNTAAVAGYEWSTGATTNSINISGAGTYWVRAYNAAGCGTRDTIVITNNPINSLFLPADTSICPEHNFNINLNPPLGTSIIWQNGTTGNTFNIAAIGLYSITATYLGCVQKDTIQVFQNPIPTKPNLGADTTLCAGATINLIVQNPTAGINYLWNTNATTTNINVNTFGNYNVTATNILGCANRDTIAVIAQTPFSINLGNDTSFCTTKPYTITATTTGNIVSYLWQNNSTLNNFIIPTIGTYWVQGTTVAGCKVRDSIVVTDNPINNFTLPNDTTICDRSSYTLALNIPAGTTTTWSDGVTANIRTINRGDNYKATANYIGCLHTDSLVVGIRPLPIINLGKDTTLCFGFDLPLQVNYPNATYTWSTGKTDSFIVAKTAGLYWAQALYNGCTFRDSIIFSTKNCDCKIIMPNAFSPNGDGINDKYIPNISCFPKDYHFTVYNRYGQPVFASKDYKEPWDGNLKNSLLPVGTYYYIMSFYNDGLMKVEQTTGYIVLLR